MTLASLSELMRQSKQDASRQQMSHQQTQPGGMRIPDYLARTSRGEALLTGQPIQESLREQFGSDGGIGAGLDMMQPMAGGMVGMFAGVGAKTANILKLRQAQKMADEGFPDDVIHATTGWFEGMADKKWRFEIPDDAAKITAPYDAKYQFYDLPPVANEAGQLVQGNKIGGLMAHDELYKAYPGTKNILLSQQAGEGGSYAPLSNQITLHTGRSKQGADVSKSTTLHELQHAIQQREGFARGGSPDEFLQGYRKQIAQLDWDISSINKELKLVSGTPRYNELLDERSVIVKQLQALEGQQGLGPLEAAHKDYRSLAGEAEARLTQKRMSMSAAERAESYPPNMFDVPVKDQLVRNALAKGERQMSITDNPAPYEVYHGGKEPFDVFDPAKSNTAQHIYTAPSEADAAPYGNVQRFTASPKKRIDFSNYDELDQPTLSALERAAADAGLTHEYMPFQQVLDEQIMPGQMYQYSGNQRSQNALLNELFGQGFDAAHMPDAGFGGAMSSSHVFEDPSLLRKQTLQGIAKGGR